MSGLAERDARAGDHGHQQKSPGAVLAGENQRMAAFAASFIRRGLMRYAPPNFHAHSVAAIIHRHPAVWTCCMPLTARMYCARSKAAGSGQRNLAHAALHLLYRFVLVLFHPLAQAALDVAEWLMPLRSSAEHSMVTLAPTMSSLITSSVP